MKKKFILTITLVLILLLSVIACATKTSTPTPTQTQIPTQSTKQNTVTTTANWWDKFGTPQYGGELNLWATTNAFTRFDPAQFPGVQGGIWEGLFNRDWLVDREICSFSMEFVPEEYYTSGLAESWRFIDPTTIEVKIKQGIKWQDKPPVNGRELTAADIEFTYDRIMGTGNGFTQVNPVYGATLSTIEKVVAKDKYTVQFKLKKSTYFVRYEVFDGGFFAIGIVAPEWVALGGLPSNTPAQDGGGMPPAGSGSSQGGGPPGPPPAPAGPLNDWKNAVGTGPYTLIDFVPGSSTKLRRNNDYWGYDERHPENKLPYIDLIDEIVITDSTTMVAAMRTNKLDIAMQMNALSWSQMDSIRKSNPDIIQAWWPVPGHALEMRVDEKPFSDIRVRKALNMAIDRKAIAQAYYHNVVSGEAAGLIHPELKGWTIPFINWPDDLKREYTYNISESKKLLAEAGYPDGFKTHALAVSNNLLVMVKGYFAELGVDLEIETVPDQGMLVNQARTGKFDHMIFTATTAMPRPPKDAIARRTTKDFENFTHNNNADYESLVSQAYSATTLEECQKFCREIDMYALANHWAIQLVPSASGIAWQPWVKGCSGEQLVAGAYFYYSRWWIDQNLKKR